VPWSGVSEVGQVKGRVLEAGWAGACLLEHADSPTRNWFTPGVDYAVYRDRNEALMAVHQLLYSDRGVTAQRMADNLARRVRAEHSAEIFWGRVWEALK
jgi:spore maturation protein CgeB